MKLGDGNVKVQRVERRCFYFFLLFSPAFPFVPLLCETLYTCSYARASAQAGTHAHTDTLAQGCLCALSTSSCRGVIR